MDNAARAAGRPAARLLAVSKTQPAEAVATLAAEGQLAFGENYVQEAAAKIARLQPAGLEWHLIGHLQSNKAEQAAQLFDWVQTVDRPKLIAALARHRPAERGPLNVLIQVNIDDEQSKHGCAPGRYCRAGRTDRRRAAAATARADGHSRPFPEREQRQAAFARMRRLFDDLALRRPSVDTLSMGMSGDYADAIAAGATMVRIGTALFGARH